MIFCEHCYYRQASYKAASTSVRFIMSCVVYMRLSILVNQQLNTTNILDKMLLNEYRCWKDKVTNAIEINKVN